MKIIDMRCRPAYLHDFFGANVGSEAYETAKWLNRRVGARGNDEHFARSLTKEGFLAEVKEAKLSYAVVVGRRTPTQQIDNDFLYEIVKDHKELLAIGGIDPALDGIDETIKEIDKIVDKLSLNGVNIESGFASPPRHPDDKIYFPIYEYLSAKNIPLSLMSGPTTPDPTFNDPNRLAKIAQTFPKLPIICYHGYYPNINQLIGVAFRYENIFPTPDMYAFLAPSQALIEAGKSFLQDQLLFGSSYPFRPIAQSIEDFEAFGFKEEILNKIFYKNAARIFGL
ncbi:MAG: amidohydrolase family protein [Helicobacteraceae bacterium]|jgi:predicted TIM-barrel fold metal-dependent hydrolase|nr:amidohydrolase family protein [Helicobacteraceae bacterium]